MKRRWIIVVALIIALPVVISVWGVIAHSGAQREVDAYKKSLIAGGEKLDIAAFIPPPLPPEQNGADIINEADGLITPDGSEWTNTVSGVRMIAPGKAMAVFAQPMAYAFSFTNSWSNLAAVMDDNRSAIELFKQAAGFPAFDFHIDYSLGPEARASYIIDFLSGARLLCTAAICDLHNGDAASATTNICAVLSLANGEQRDPLLTPQLIRFALVAYAADASWELLQSTNVSDAQLALLQKSWERLEYLRALEKSLLMERAINEMTIQKMRDSPEYMGHIMSSYALSRSGSSPGSGTPASLWNSVKAGYAKSMWRAAWTYSDELRMLQEDQIAFDALRAIETNGAFYPDYGAMDARRAALGITNQPESVLSFNSDIHWMFSRSSSASTAIRRGMTFEVARTAVVTAIALKRYQLQHNHYPDSLSQLVPQFLAAVPRDPVDGNSMRYRPNSDGTFLLYSVGVNGKDDGGNPMLDISTTSQVSSWLNAHALDFVWPRPATPAEIQYFFDHPPK